MLAKNLSNSSGGSAVTTYVDDVFSAYTYTGNGATQTINNGIDLAGKGGMVWSKSRGSVGAGELRDSARGTAILQPSTTSAQIAAASDVTAFNSNGYNLGFVSGTANQGSTTFVAWTFAKAPKFFDVVTYTGDGSSVQTVAHSLGVSPGLVICKRTDTTSSWGCYHRGSGGGMTKFELNSTNFPTITANVPDFNASTIMVGAVQDNASVRMNALGGTYVAYLFAHDTSTDGLIQCGSFTTDASGNATVNLGWEPQYLLRKTSSAAGGWFITDVSRGMSVNAASNNNLLYANLSNAEGATSGVEPTANGFNITGGGPSNTFIYLAIRRPNKPPTVGTQVYNAIARPGTGAAATVTGVGFAPDLAIISGRTVGTNHIACDRLRGAIGSTVLATEGTFSEQSSIGYLTSFDQDGISIGTTATINGSGNTHINHFFKRAAGVHDQVCYNGTGVVKTEAHNLGVVPELMIVKARSSASLWSTYHVANGANYSLDLSQSAAKYLVGANDWNNTTPTASVFSLGGSGGVTNTNAVTFVAYLFATKAGISKVGSYTGNGGSQTINCGFTTGARFILIKRTDSTGDWFVFDTVRGIVAGNDPHLSINTTVAEVTTDDSIDPGTSGFIVNQVAATNINVTSATYIYLAFA